MSNNARLRADSGGIQEPLSQTPWDRPKYIRMLRVMLSDFEQLNTVLLSKESSDEKLGLMVDLALADFNGDTPPTTFQVNDFPNPKCLLEGAIVETLMSVGLIHARNAMTYTDDGVSVEDFGKDPRLLNFAQLHLQAYNSLKDSLKRYLNAKMTYGGFGSEYGWINRIIR